MGLLETGWPYNVQSQESHGSSGSKVHKRSITVFVKQLTTVQRLLHDSAT